MKNNLKLLKLSGLIFKYSITNKRKSVSAYEGFISSFGEQIEEIKFSKLEFKLEKRKYSSTVSPVLYIDNIPCNCNEMKTHRIFRFKVQKF